MIFFILASFICIIYLALLSLVYVGIQKKNRIQSPSTNKLLHKFSILVPFRNEAHRIENLLESLGKLTYPNTHFEIIFIDDHSTDDSKKVIQQKLINTIEAKIISVPMHLKGKKQALLLGVEESKYDHIVTTDADCWVPSTWLGSYNATFSATNADLCIGAVSMRNGTTWLEKFQYYDYIAMQAFNLGLSQFFNPILCSGANLAYLKKSFLTCNAYANNKNIASGDDMFLLEAMLEKKMTYSLVYEPENLVYTEPSTSISVLIEQRKRWLTKLPKSKNTVAKNIGWLLALGNGVWLLLLVAATTSNTHLNLFILFSILKWACEFFVTLNVMKYLHLLRCNKMQLLFQVLYPIVMLMFAVNLVMNKNTFWKERKISS